MKAFETLIESQVIEPTETHHVNRKYIDGEAKEVVDGYMFLDSEDTYQRVKEMLTKRFGDCFLWRHLPEKTASLAKTFSK